MERAAAAALHPLTAHEPRRSRVQRILLATDLSEASDAATTSALDLAHDLGAELLVLSVIDPAVGSYPGAPAAARVDQLRDLRERAARDLVLRGRREGLRISSIVWQGEPGEAIVEAAASEQVDLVVVGSHGRGSVGRLLLGSVSEHVVREAPCPVLVVRKPRRSAPR
jgi:nucleotide-binding universal stress UspA family protein